ncbi:MAG TPA: hypothetical protein PKM05_08795, partial [Smithellaceae bacterium]|nr:hypothetical protein [Smithellaceae bacterium]HPW23988.1 hypothetical protein [Smithellaceae bacterium]
CVLAAPGKTRAVNPLFVFLPYLRKKGGMANTRHAPSVLIPAPDDGYLLNIYDEQSINIDGGLF